jgi:hypothetical protein
MSETHGQTGRAALIPGLAGGAAGQSLVMMNIGFWWKLV